MWGLPNGTAGYAGMINSLEEGCLLFAPAENQGGEKMPMLSLFMKRREKGIKLAVSIISLKNISLQGCVLPAACGWSLVRLVRHQAAWTMLVHEVGRWLLSEASSLPMESCLGRIWSSAEWQSSGLNIRFQPCTNMKGEARCAGWACLNVGRKAALQLNAVFVVC